jgi:hypothetical protein
MNDTIRLLVQQLSQKTQDGPEGVTKTRSKGKGKASAKTVTISDQVDEPERRSSIARISNTISGIFTSPSQPSPVPGCSTDMVDDETSSHASEESFVRINPVSNLSSVNLETTTQFWVTKIQLDLNSSPVDQFESVQTEDQAIQDFLRLFNTNKQANSLYTCGLNYEEFLKGFFIAGYDLSCANDSSNPYGVPTVRSGHLRLKILFNKAAESELTCLAFAEFPELLELGNGAKTIKSSYVPK